MTQKEKGAVPFESAPASNASDPDSNRIARLKAIAADLPGNDVETQRERVLTALQEGPVSTVEARRHLDVTSIRCGALSRPNAAACIGWRGTSCAWG